MGDDSWLVQQVHAPEQRILQSKPQICSLSCDLIEKLQQVTRHSVKPT